MKSGTGDVWGSDDEDEDDETEASGEVEESEASGGLEESEVGGDVGDSVGRDRDDDGDFPDEQDGGTGSERAATDEGGSSEEARENDIPDNALSSATETAGSTPDGTDGGGEQSYVVRRMLKDKSVQFERDERLTLFVHDDVKAGEQELEAEAQELFGRDIPVFDIREAVYRAALRNRDDVVAELEEMGYTRE
jgi:hypothetical protein